MGMNANEVGFAGANGDGVSALLVPARTAAPHAGLLFLHWGFGDRTSFAREAEAYAACGVTSLGIDAPGFGARKGPRVGAREPARVRAYAEQLLGDLAAATSFLCAQPGVAPDRIAYVGHSLGATIAGAFLAREPRVRAAVLMAGAGELSRLWLQRRDPEGSRALQDLDAVRCLPRARAALYFQFAERDAWISRADAEAQLAAAPEPKRADWYACDHALGADALRDRARFLAGALALASGPDLPAGDQLPRRQLRTQRVVAPLVRFASWLSRRG
jgi:alpha-beta hydrolase superfamily lysophospholipase